MGADTNDLDTREEDKHRTNKTLRDRDWEKCEEEEEVVCNINEDDPREDR